MELLALVEANSAKLYDNPLFFSLIILLFSLAIWLKLAEKKKLKLPPSPPKLPIIGNIHQLGKLPHRSLQDLSKKYGPLMLMQLGHNPTLVVSSVDMAKEIFKNHDIVFSGRPSSTAAKILLYGCTDIGFSPYGEYWRQIRKICVLELLSLRRVHSFQFVRDEEVEVLINKIRRASSQGESINLTEMLMAASFNIVARSATSRRTEEDEGSNKFGQLARRLMVLMATFSIGDLFPSLSWVDWLTGFVPSLKAFSRELDSFLDQIIEEHRALTSHVDEVSDSKKDFVSIILQLQKDGMLETELTQDNIKAMILDMLVGGTDTIARTMDWLMAELIKHPKVMKKVQEEVRNVVGSNKSKVDVEDINKMEYFKCVVKETLRLHAGSLIVRELSANIKLGGYDVPSKTTVYINAFAIQRDPSWWEKPDEFMPERFLNCAFDFKGQDFQYIPFGSGRKGCPGMSLGIATVEYVIANILYFFDWKLPAGEVAEDLDMSELIGLAVYKKVPLHVLPIIKSP